MRQLAEEGRAAREAAAARKTTADIPAAEYFAGGYGAEANVVMNSTDCEHGVPPDERCVICDAGQP